ncbi:MAG: aminotransferase class I/II-fold pyridoxal phosphate-dependent enzyme [Candidatus Melainabacteria bacterium]|nr:aminotransferase class I/II-fold pyridoxal phosphate-dependent enzyme [Candidatus Melainabacteria bacterium]MBI3308450.1 aminotransferase class I/II-fold pyridoxal phosphate-dependent enzyme [Candidatus Melainabacteria bacterium]
MSIAPFNLERFYARYEFEVPYIMCSSDPESFSIEELLSFESGSIDEFKKQWLGYTETKGNPKLRSEITKLYKDIKEENIIVHAGAEEVIFVFMNSMINPDDHVIVHFPNYQSLEEIARFKGAEITRWETKEENDWELDTEFLKKAIKKNTRCIIINFPHNPTGYLPSKEKLNEIIEIARKHNIYIFSDEVYRFLEYDNNDRLPAICDLYENGVSVGVMSKAFALPGLRIGWVATRNKEVLEKMAMFKDYTTICSSAPSEYLAIIGLKNKEKILKRNLGIISENLNKLNEFFNRHKSLFNWKKPKAGTIAFPSIKKEINIEDFCLDLINKKGLMLLPGTKYDFGTKNFRIGFGRKNLPLCLNKLEEYLVTSSSSISKIRF